MKRLLVTLTLLSASALAQANPSNFCQPLSTFTRHVVDAALQRLDKDVSKTAVFAALAEKAKTATEQMNIATIFAIIQTSLDEYRTAALTSEAVYVACMRDSPESI